MSGAYCSLKDLVNLRLKARNLPLFRHTVSRSLMSGGARSPFKGRGVDFEEVRAYQFGDDIRSIDWRVTARRMKPHTKVFKEERERPVMVLMDQSHSLFFGSQLNFKSVTAAEAAGMISWATLQHGDRIGGVLFNENTLTEIRPKRSNKSLMHLFSQTEKLNNELSIRTMTSSTSKGHLAKALRHARRVAHPGTHIFLISDFNDMDEETGRHLRNLSRHCQVMALQVSDPLEQELPAPDRYTITNGMHRQTIDTRHRSLRQQFNQQSVSRNQWLTDEFKRYRIPLLQLNAAEDTSEQLLALFGSSRGSHRG
ncbi:hypothetical protein ACH42_14530 [Endozoicomonas sp. (ex Bugula neritina AB1)]|nr:hypothetical protein ACH42_14530 [Endozoicomonas sp. (ex Bugula neritina AB1)]